jgi:hypothetical protein
VVFLLVFDRIPIRESPSLSWASDLPCAFVVIFMSQHVTDKDNLISKKDLNDQTVLVAANVNYGQVSNLVGAGAVGFHMGEIAPLRFSGELIPARQRLLGVSMNFPEFPQPSPRDHVHAEILTT